MAGRPLASLATVCDAIGGGGEDRTPDSRLMSPVLYQLSYPAEKFLSPDGFEPSTPSLKVMCSTKLSYGLTNFFCQSSKLPSCSPQNAAKSAPLDLRRIRPKN